MKLGINYMDQHFDNSFEGHCESNCYLNIMEYYGIKHPLLYLNPAPSLHLFESDENSVGYGFRFNEERLLPDYLKNKHSGTVKGKEFVRIDGEIREKIKEGIPVVAAVDIFYLPYVPHYQVYHALHAIILADDTENDNEVPVIDWYQWKYKGMISKKQFYEARTSLCPKDESPHSGSPADNIWFFLDPSGWQGEAQELLRAAIGNSQRYFYDTGSRNKDGNYYGIEAMKKIAAMLRERQEEAESNLYLMKELRSVFYLLSVRMKLFCYYIGESSKILESKILEAPLPPLTELHQGLEQDLAVWSRTMTAFLKYTCNPTNKGYQKIMTIIEELIRLEENRCESLTRLSRIL